MAIFSRLLVKTFCSFVAVFALVPGEAAIARSLDGSGAEYMANDKAVKRLGRGDDNRNNSLSQPVVLAQVKESKENKNSAEIKVLTDKAVGAIRKILKKDGTAPSKVAMESKRLKDAISAIQELTRRAKAEENMQDYVINLLDELLDARYGSGTEVKNIKRKKLITRIVLLAISQDEPAVDPAYTASLEQEAAVTDLGVVDCNRLLREEVERGQIQFEMNSSKIDVRSNERLDHIAKIINRCSKFSVSIEGHTDASGPRLANQRLSLHRAQAVMEYLHKIGGVAKDRLSAVGFGEEKPIVPNDTPAHRSQNRRIEFRVK